MTDNAQQTLNDHNSSPSTSCSGELIKRYRETMNSEMNVPIYKITEIKNVQINVQWIFGFLLFLDFSLSIERGINMTFSVKEG